ncbi:acyl carrier protein [Luteibacter sp. Sphag1AF]|uniref:phosphopantetheine-binding protein n=1 Tax=Luteibacter sp. Sphag1AF TaxID=2587031 RepID=UPI001607B9C6|nr:phosphopantetheine-binding protein [Luteibacter sp. Sphag1AF]MBB3227265.1 acyl carrier protein [Luteibacter sp. Sphag1AF]
MTDLERDIAQLIIDTLNLEETTVADIPADLPLFGQGLGLDSVDALELALALQNVYGIKLAADSRDARQHFATVGNMARFVEAQRLPCND